ncbi:MAG: MFS transporter [Solirubrobacteraceae bacterium]|nr:MFS transporter [Solirubrobacteraceae bacterium]
MHLRHREPRPAPGATFAALQNPNFRTYYAGQAVSLVGTWMQMTAMAWLVLSLTGSSTKLGIVIALQTLPVLVFGPYGGVIADRVDKRRLMVALQTAMGLQALILGVLTISGGVEFWMIGALAALLGLNNAFENPARQAFILEMVGPDQLRNAVSLNSLLVNAARVVGPAVAGLMIAAIGEGWCFLLNAASFVAVVGSLVALDRSQLSPSPPVVRGAGQLREGLSYVKGEPQIGIPLLMMAITGVLAYEFQVSLPVFAQDSLGGSSEVFGFLTAAMGVGAVAGALRVARSGTTGLRPLSLAAAGLGVALLLTAVAPSLPVALFTLVLVGWSSVTYMATGNTTLQLGAAPHMRGRVMSLWFVAFQGSTPIGGPLIGAIIAATDARVGLAVGGVACLVVAVGGRVACMRLDDVVEIELPNDDDKTRPAGGRAPRDADARTGEFVAVAAER